jgi:hypothetical protein
MGRELLWMAAAQPGLQESQNSPQMRTRGWDVTKDFYRGLQRTTEPGETFVRLHRSLVKWT